MALGQAVPKSHAAAELTAAVSFWWEGFLRRPPTSALIKQRREKVQFKR